MLGNKLAETALDTGAINHTLLELEAVLSDIQLLLDAERFEEASAQSDAMYDLMASLPRRASHEQMSRLGSMMSHNQEMAAQLTNALLSFQSTGRKRQKAISGYSKR